MTSDGQRFTPLGSNPGRSAEGRVSYPPHLTYRSALVMVKLPHGILAGAGAGGPRDSPILAEVKRHRPLLAQGWGTVCLQRPLIRKATFGIASVADIHRTVFLVMPHGGKSNL